MTAALTLPGVPPAPDGEAFIDGKYRYWLRDAWDTSLPRLLFVMLNPSTATGRRAEHDPTVKKCIRIAKEHAFGAIEIVNLFAFRSPHPYDLLHEEDPIGPRNDGVIVTSAAAARTVVCAWGAGFGGKLRERIRLRARRVLRLLGERELYALGVTKDGEPSHPLARGKAYLPDDAPLIPWPEER